MKKNDDVVMNKTFESQIISCGIIMPISAIDDCKEEHWADVLSIIKDVIKNSGYEPKLVSDADDIGVIQKRIIQNLYCNPLIICDVSGKNPNVMFELGMRLAFDKPTIIIKDDHTSFSFDTSPIEHLLYPRDLRFNKIVDFKEKLSSKLKATYDASQNDDNFSTFLKNFGDFKTAKIETKEISKEDYILEELNDIRRLIQRIPRNYRQNGFISKISNDSMKEECKFRLNSFINRCFDYIEKNKIDLTSLDDYRRLIKLANSDELPNCFDEEKVSCRNKIIEILKNKSFNPIL
jgi:hypothetical protein